MKIRTLLTFTGIVSSLLGALIAYLILSVPNDLRADALLKQARQEMTDGQNDKARESLSRIMQQYPRTDAGAAATVALVSIGQKERDDLSRAVTVLRKQNEEQTKLIRELQAAVARIRSAPPPAPVVVAPAPKPVAKKVVPAKKPTPKKTTRRRR